MIRRLAACAALLLPLVTPAYPEQRTPTREARDSLYEKWVAEDVRYIITPEERDTFSRLTTDAERESFIEQFWRRRDTDTDTAVNEFKEEHYRRIAYANQHFHSGEPGWQTDRGEIFIKFGPPDAIESYPSGAPYARRMGEGGGRTIVHPFQRWRYNQIPGVGPNVEIEFVDPSGTGEYRIALSPQEKDALLYVQTMNAGKTEGEMAGLEDRWLRLTRDSGLGIQSRSGHYSIHPDDFPYEKLQRLALLQKAPVSAKAASLREEVTARTIYNPLPLRLAATPFRLAGNRYLVPVTVAVENQALQYRAYGLEYRSQVEFFGRVSDLTANTREEFEHSRLNGVDQRELQSEMAGSSAFQKLLVLPAGRYKLEVLAQDTGSGRIGALEESLYLPEAVGETLALSPLLLAEQVRREEALPEAQRDFTLGGLQVIPSLSRVFPRNAALHVYLQAYQVRLDQQTQEPSLEVRYFLLRDGRTASAFPDMEGLSIRYVSPERVVLSAAFNLQTLDPGTYRVLVRVRDRISEQQAEAEASVAVK